MAVRGHDVATWDYVVLLGTGRQADVINNTWVFVLTLRLRSDVCVCTSSAISSRRSIQKIVLRQTELFIDVFKERFEPPAQRRSKGRRPHRRPNKEKVSSSERMIER